MNSSKQRNIIVAASALLVGSLVLLHAGNFIQFDDISGYGSEKWVMWLGYLAGYAATASVIVAAFDARASRIHGMALIGVCLLLGFLRFTVDGFRFVWARDEGELMILLVAVSLLGLIMTTARRTTATAPTVGEVPRSGVSGWTRTVAYLCGVVFAMFVAFNAGVAYFDRTVCGAPGMDGDCDLGPLVGFEWAAITLLVGLAAITISEVVVRRRRTQLR